MIQLESAGSFDAGVRGGNVSYLDGSRAEAPRRRRVSGGIKRRISETDRKQSVRSAFRGEPMMSQETKSPCVSRRTILIGAAGAVPLIVLGATGAKRPRWRRARSATRTRRRTASSAAAATFHRAERLQERRRRRLPRRLVRALGQEGRADEGWGQPAADKLTHRSCISHLHLRRISMNPLPGMAVRKMRRLRRPLVVRAAARCWDTRVRRAYRAGRDDGSGGSRERGASAQTVGNSSPSRELCAALIAGAAAFLAASAGPAEALPATPARPASPAPPATPPFPN